MAYIALSSDEMTNYLIQDTKYWFSQQSNLVIRIKLLIKQRQSLHNQKENENNEMKTKLFISFGAKLRTDSVHIRISLGVCTRFEMLN